MVEELEPRRLVPQTTDQARRGGGWVPPQVQRPDFMIVGLTLPAGDVLLFSSTTLTQAELRRKLDGYLSPPGLTRPKIPVEKIEVHAVMRDFTLIHGEDYPSALRSLMEDWARKSQRRGIGQ